MLQSAERENRKVLTERRTDAGLYEVIILEDGGYRLALNGEILNVFCWKSGEFEDCMRTLNRLSAIAAEDRA